MSVRFQRANFLVSDIEAALRFYVDVLGMEVAFRRPHRDESYSHVVFELDRSKPVGFVCLSTPTEPRVMGLTEVAGLVRHPAPRRATIVLHVDDPDAVIARARADGYEVIPEQELVTHDGRRGREIGLLDADGNVVVIYRITAPAPD